MNTADQNGADQSSVVATECQGEEHRPIDHGEGDGSSTLGPRHGLGSATCRREP